MNLDPALYYRAVQARDARYDGRFFTCVKTTGIYCRPICPARPPKFENCTFVPTAAAAQAAGFRPCLRCHPECSPDLDAWRGTASTASRAMKLIEAGELDNGDIVSLADRLQIGERQLRRLFRQHIGAAPIAVAQTRRLLLARQLIHQTNLSMIHVALASGFGSVRRFNETFQRLYQRAPSELRRRATGASGPEISLLLPYRPPYDWGAMIRFLTARAIVGLEVVTDETYARVIKCGDAVGSIEISDAPEESALRVIVRCPKLNLLPAVIARVRRMFDLGAEPGAIGAALSVDPILAPLIAARPGVRVPGGWDGFEIAVRAVLGQQITLKGATQLAGRLVAQLGETIDDRVNIAGLTQAFPRPERFTANALAKLGITKPRAATIVGLASAVRSDPKLFDPRGDLADAVSRLREFSGVGEWTAQYIAMRALGESDAFLADDVGLQRKFSVYHPRATAPAILAHAQRWRPWRAYAMQYLWMNDSESTATAKIKETRHALTA
jgi:AraC family transcriptional regulator of adaptative response / DNA-3-methyladenine glycosylase II